MYFIFPPHLTSASALPGETGNPEIASFHLNTACFFTKNTKHSYSWSQDTFVNASSLSVQEIVLHLRIAFEAGLCYQLVVYDNVQLSAEYYAFTAIAVVQSAFYIDLLLRSYLYHCV